jgi:GTP cyclohydrolase II
MPDMTLADSTQNPPPQESDRDPKWNNLPAICSPRPAPVSHGLIGLDPAPSHLTPTALPSYLHPARPTDDRSMDGRLSRSSTPDTSVLPSLLSPAFTPPTTPGVGNDEAEHVSKKPRLLENLPNVNCVVRARIPT